MGIKTLNLESIEPFVSKSDPDYREDGKHLKGASIFHLGVLDSVKLSALRDDLASYTDDGGMNLRGSDNDVLAARMVIKGWDNIDVPFTSSEVLMRGHKWELADEECVAAIPLRVLREIGQHAKSQNQLTVDQVKNSDSASSGTNTSPTENAENAQPEASSDGGVTPAKKETKKGS